MKRTVIYCGNHHGEYHTWVNEHSQPMRHDEAWWFPEIDYEHGVVPRHPAKIIQLVPEMVGNIIVTMSEHIILAFQQLIRQGQLDPDYLYLYCGNTIIELDEDGDIEWWPGKFFGERLELLL